MRRLFRYSSVQLLLVGRVGMGRETAQRVQGKGRTNMSKQHNTPRSSSRGTTSSRVTSRGSKRLQQQIRGNSSSRRSNRGRPNTTKTTTTCLVGLR
jgi:hypothetical protein